MAGVSRRKMEVDSQSLVIEVSYFESDLYQCECKLITKICSIHLTQNFVEDYNFSVELIVTVNVPFA